MSDSIINGRTLYNTSVVLTPKKGKKETTIEGRQIIEDLNKFAGANPQKVHPDIAETYILLCLQGTKFKDIYIEGKNGKAFTEEFIDILNQASYGYHREGKKAGQKYTLDEYSAIFTQETKKGKRELKSCVASVPVRTKAALFHGFGQNSYDGIKDLRHLRNTILYESNRAQKDFGWTVGDVDGNGIENEDIDKYLAMQNRYYAEAEFETREDATEVLNAAKAKAQEAAGTAFAGTKKAEDLNPEKDATDPDNVHYGEFAYHSSILDKDAATMTHEEYIRALQSHILLNPDIEIKDIAAANTEDIVEEEVVKVVEEKADEVTTGVITEKSKSIEYSSKNDPEYVKGSEGLKLIGARQYAFINFKGSIELRVQLGKKGNIQSTRGLGGKDNQKHIQNLKKVFFLNGKPHLLVKEGETWKVLEWYDYHKVKEVNIDLFRIGEANGEIHIQYVPDSAVASSK